MRSKHSMSNATCPSSTSLTVTTRVPYPPSAPRIKRVRMHQIRSRLPAGTTHLGDPRRSLTGSRAVDRDLWLYRRAATAFVDQRRHHPVLARGRVGGFGHHPAAPPRVHADGDG